MCLFVFYFIFSIQPDDKENNEENDDTPTNSNYDAATLVIGEKKNGFSDKKVCKSFQNVSFKVQLTP